MMVALLVLIRLRSLSDELVVSQVKENRYVQYFCNVPDEGLHTFINPSSLCKFRKRLGPEGMKTIEEECFEKLRRAQVIHNDAQLIDSTVMEDNIIHPTDVLLLYKAFVKMGLFAKNNAIPVWWDEQYLKKRWRAFNFAKKGKKMAFLWEFYLLFSVGLQIFEFHIEHCSLTKRQKKRGRILLALLTVLDEQTQLKLEGKIHIENRIVSLDEVDARPIKKGKSYPSCEFGTTLQTSFNRDGFMITAENFIGKPNDTKLYPSTVELYRKRMKDYPEVAVADRGARSRKNFKESEGKVQHIFLGRSEDVAEEKQDYCRRARSATEGFIAVAKNWRGFGRSLYRGFAGNKIWTFLCQIAYNLKKFLQLYKKDQIEEKSLIKLGLLPA
jgi:IS5 family transposase